MCRSYFFYLELWTDCNEKTGLLVPHENKSRLDCHHYVNAHFLYLKRLDSALYHL